MSIYREEQLLLVIFVLMVALMLLLPKEYDPAYRLGQWLRQKRKKK